MILILNTETVVRNIMRLAEMRGFFYAMKWKNKYFCCVILYFVFVRACIYIEKEHLFAAEFQRREDALFDCGNISETHTFLNYILNVS